MASENFFNIDNPQGGIPRTLAEGITTNVFPGDQAMVSVVRLAPNSVGSMHDHPEEQWGFCAEGSGVRTQGGEEVPVSKGDFWRTPGGVPHMIVAGPEGMTVLDVFAPPRKEYTKPGSGFGG